jgi:imidazolonepropionase-like amidohydrolase
LRIHATAANDIRAAVTIADEFKVPHIVIDDCIEGYRDLDILAARHIPVVLGPLFDPQLVSPERAAAVLNNAGLLSDAGVPVAFGSHGGDETQLREYAIYAVRAGMKPDLALRALTLTAAEIGGVADRVGSLQDGKDADLLILSGDPLDLTSHIERVIVNGQVVYRAE